MVSTGCLLFVVCENGISKEGDMKNKFICALGAILIAGCGSDDPWLSKQKPTADAAGYVTLNGKPLPNASIVFSPTQKDGVGATGFSDDDGYFEVSAYPSKTGAVPGDYKIIVFSTTPAKEKAEKFDPGEDAEHHQDGDEVTRMKNTVPSQYSKKESTPLSVNIPDGGNSDIKLDLQG